MMTEAQDFDVRLSVEKDGLRQALSILVSAMSHDEAKMQAISATELDGWRSAEVMWCVIYPRGKWPRPTRAITD